METGRPNGIKRWFFVRRAPLFVLLVLMPLLGGFLVLAHGLEPLLMRRGPVLLPDYSSWFQGVQSLDFVSWLLWYIGDVSEGAFMKSLPASVLYLICSLIGAAWDRRLAESEHRDPEPFLYVGRKFGFALLSLLISCIACSWGVGYGWIPTFTAFLMTQILIGFVGHEMIQCLTVAVLCGLTMGPLSTLIIYGFSSPLDLPAFVGSGTGMAIATIVDCEIMRLLPWMHMAEPDYGPNVPPQRPARLTVSEARQKVVAGMFCDVATMSGVGTTLGGLGLAFGLLLGWELNPMHGFYGNPAPNLLAILLATSALSITFHYPVFRREGSAYTLPALLAMGAIACTYENSLAINVPALIVAAILAPWAARQIICRFTFLHRWPTSVVMQAAAVFFTAALSSIIVLTAMILR